MFSVASGASRSGQIRLYAIRDMMQQRHSTPRPDADAPKLSGPSRTAKRLVGRGAFPREEYENGEPDDGRADHFET